MSRPGVTFRPRVETLEDREVPASLVWMPVPDSYEFSYAANWRDSSTLAMVAQGPKAGDDLYFDGTRSSARCDNMILVASPGGGGGESLMAGQDSFSPGIDEYHSVNMINGYSGTVKVALGFATEILVLSSIPGAFSQPAAYTDITVTQSFTWTGGTLNSSTYTSNVNILGNGNIAPINSGTVVTGSTLNFIGTDATPTTTTIQPGTLAFNNAAGAVVGYAATVKVNVIVNNPGLITGWGQAGANSWTINSGGSLEYVGTGIESSNMRVLNNGGLFKLNGQVRLTLSGGDEMHVSFLQDNANSRLHIVNGSTLVATNWVRINAGSVYLIMNPDLPVNQQTATISGNFYFNGGDIVFSLPIMIGGGLSYGGFKVEGDVVWSGGRFIPTVDCAGLGGAANHWAITGTLTVDTSKTDKPRIEPNPNRVPPGQPVAGTWEVIRAGNIQGDDPILSEGWELLTGTSGGFKRFYVKK